MADLEALKLKRDQLTARIQKAETLARSSQTKEENRVKVLVGAAVLHQQKTLPAEKLAALVALLDGFLTRKSERLAVLGEDGKGSETLKRLVSGVE